MKKKKQEKEIIPCETLEDAEKIVSDKRAAGINPRVIAQTTFLINGQEKRFNIVQISKIQKNNDQNQNNELNSNTNPRDNDKSLVFKLFKEGLGPEDVVIETGMSVDYVGESHQEYLDFKNQMIFPKEDLDWYYRLMLPYRKCEDPAQLGNAIQNVVRDALNYRKLNYPCTNCGEIIEFNTQEIEWVRTRLSENWGHSKCPDDY